MSDETPSPPPAEGDAVLQAPPPALAPGATTLLFLTVLIIATSGLVYELLAGTVASYVLGDSVTQFSTTIGTYLFAMGIGSFLSRFIKADVPARFLEIELAAALVGGGSAPLLFLGFAHAESFGILLYGLIMVIGILVGLEIPLLMRILKERLAFEELVAKVLTFDYVGALFGSVLFALFFVPTLGLTRTSLFFGMLNAAVAVIGSVILRPLLDRATVVRVRVLAALVAALLLTAFVRAEELTTWSEQDLYTDPVVLAVQSPYQRIVVTRSGDRMSLFLNGNLQFSSPDEHRYHEALVHPAMSLAPRRERVLILGGGDGLALREVFRYPSVREVTLVDLDPAMTETAARIFADLNQRALEDPRLELVNDDALVWLDERPADAAPYDAVIIDFPDPNNFSLGKLYTARFYRLAARALADDGALVVQSTSPLFARRSFWCIERTMRETGLRTGPYHATVPSFGTWGFVLARKTPFDPPERLAPEVQPLRFLTDDVLPTLFVFPADMARLDVEPNRLNDQTLVRYYESETRGLER
ncbi:MAG: polyamine aminopropyltransferase [Myxococcales bacterium]|nr:polyamine aminopropyltransferase [Myxococcales bacterium]